MDYGTIWQERFTKRLKSYNAHLQYEGVGEFPNVELTFKLKSYELIRCDTYQVPYKLWPTLFMLLTKYLKQGLIEQSHHPEWSFPCFLMKKNSGKYQLVLDSRRLNDITITEKSDLPTIDDIMNNLHGSGMFSKFDISNGYGHMKIKEEHRKYTSFSTPFGHFQF